MRYKILPRLLEELRNAGTQALVLPLVLQVGQQQDPEDFVRATLPTLEQARAGGTGQGQPGTGAGGGYREPWGRAHLQGAQGPWCHVAADRLHR